ncbi:MAG: glutamyl-tRNA reductase [Chloroflexota bacterium]|nr:glutamyl-tRNA reductase [Chloroflexota bacterium]
MPRVVMIGLSHHATPLEVRERVAVDEAAWRRSAPAQPPTLLLSTCNRVEVYAWVEGRPSSAIRGLQRALARASGVPLTQLQPHLKALTGHDAILHLVRVTTGLDSLVVGEEQIRGQVHQTLAAAEASQALSPALRGIFERAGESARRIRSRTRLGQVPSIATAGVNVACRVLAQDLHGKLAIVLGAGVMARAAAASLVAQGARVCVLNRTPDNAERIVAQLGSAAEVGSLQTLSDALLDAALVVGATASRSPVVDRAVVEAAMRARAGRPLVLLDIALPRDIAPTVRRLAGVTLIDLDDLERECPVDADTRLAEHRRAEALAVEETDRVVEWLRLRAGSPAITELRTYAETIRQNELRRSAARLRDLTPEQTAAVDALTTGIVNKLMHGPTVALRDAAARPGGLSRSRTRIQRVLQPPRGRTA